MCPLLTLRRIIRKDDYVNSTSKGGQSGSMMPNIIRLSPGQKKIIVGCPGDEHPPDVCMKSKSNPVSMEQFEDLNVVGFQSGIKNKIGTYLR